MSWSSGLPFLAMVPIGLAIGGLFFHLANRLISRREHKLSAPAVALLLLIPFALTVAALVSTLAPLAWGSCHCVEHGHVSAHLCPLHLTLAAPFIWPSALLVVGWIAGVWPKLKTTLSATRATARRAFQLRRLPTQRVGSTEIRLADAGAPIAFTIGIIKPVIVIDRALYAELTDDERRAVVEHENAHALRKDGLTYCVLRYVVALCPFEGAARLLNLWRQASERRCDQHAARAVGDPLAVAGALLKIARLRLRSADDSHIADGFAHCAVEAVDSTLETRVKTLLSHEPSRRLRHPQSDLRFAAWATAVLIGLAMGHPHGTTHHAFTCFLGG